MHSHTLSHDLGNYLAPVGDVADEACPIWDGWAPPADDDLEQDAGSNALASFYGLDDSSDATPSIIAMIGANGPDAESIALAELYDGLDVEDSADVIAVIGPDLGTTRRAAQVSG